MATKMFDVFLEEQKSGWKRELYWMKKKAKQLKDITWRRKQIFNFHSKLSCHILIGLNPLKGVVRIGATF